MIKFFRKYTKALLAVFMGLLVIVWVGGSALTSLMAGSMTGQVLATTVDGDIIQSDQMIAQNETDLLSRLRLNWRQPIPGAGGEPLSVMDWILLTREAKRWGITAGAAECRQFLRNVGISENDLVRLAQRSDIRVEQIYSAVGQFLAVRQAADLAVSAASRSEATVRRAARDELEKVRVNLVAIRASTLADPDATFTDAEMQAQFEQFRDTKGSAGMAFGYVQSPQVRVQYVKIDLDAIADSVVIRERTLEKRAREYWRANRQAPEFRRPAEETPDEDAGPVEPPSPFFEKFDEAKEVAVAAVRREHAGRKVEAIAAWLLGALAEPWDTADSGEDGYKTGGVEVIAADHYASVLTRMPQSLPFAGAVSVHTTEFFKQSQAFGKAPELTRARLSRQTAGGARGFSDAVFRVQGVVPMPTAPDAPKSDYLAIGQTFATSLVGSDGSRYVFRVVEAKPSGPAESLDLVRDDVIRDLRTARGFAEAQRMVGTLVLSITGDGLKAAFDADAEMQEALGDVTAYYSPAPFARKRAGGFGGLSQSFPSYVAGMGIVDEEVVSQCFALAGAPSKTTVIPIESSATVAVVEWIETLPLREDDYEAQRNRIVLQVNRRVLFRAAGDWLDPTRIRDRNGYTVTR